MLNPTCPLCQSPLTTSAAWRESYTVMILLRCECGYETVVRVPNSRFPVLTIPEMVEAMSDCLDEIDKDMKIISDTWRW